MSPVARTGLLATAITGAGAALVGGVFLVVVLAQQPSPGQEPGRPPGAPEKAGEKAGRADPPESQPPTPAELDDPNYKAILTHKFFDKKPTAATVEKVIDLILTGNKSQAVCWGAKGEYGRYDVWESILKPGGPTVNRPYIRLDMSMWRARPTRAEVVAALKAALDRADFERRD